MRLSVLGSDGGIGKGRRTSCFLIDDDILIDAGTGLGELEPEDMAKIDHIFLSHIHMDHIACLPLLVDSILPLRRSPVTVHVPGSDHEDLARHIFNDVIWPDFTQIPSPDRPSIRFLPLSDTPYEFGGRRLGSLPVDHHGEAAGFWLDGGSGQLAFTGDTGPCPAFWQAVNSLPDVRYVIIECSFPSAMEELALKTGHLTPALLEREIVQLDSRPAILATHMKPFAKAKIVEELSMLTTPHDISILKGGQIIEF